jgi:hypothetical protein
MAGVGERSDHVVADFVIIGPDTRSNCGDQIVRLGAKLAAHHVDCRGRHARARASPSRMHRGGRTTPAIDDQDG